MIGQPYTIYLYRHRGSKPTLHLQEVNFVNFDPFLSAFLVVLNQHLEHLKSDLFRMRDSTA